MDEWGRPVFNVFIRQDKPVASYLTPLTGLSKETLENYGLPLGERMMMMTVMMMVMVTCQAAEAMALLRAHVPPNAVLVGQNIQNDVQWLQLAEGVDYESLIDLAALFRVFDPARGQFITFSQDHTAAIWLGYAA